MKKKKKKDSITALLLCAFTGIFGGHKFYLEKNTAGILHLISFVLLVLARLAGPLFLLVLVWWVIDMILVSKEVDSDNENIEGDAEPGQNASSGTQEAAIGQQAIPEGNAIKLQLMRASSLLEHNVLTAPEFGTLNERIASGELILTQDKYRDVLNLRSMRDRESIDDFVYDMQKSKILELKYLSD